MSDWPSSPIFPNVTLSVVSIESLGVAMSSLGLTAASFTSAAWPTANKAFFVPVWVARQTTLVKAFVYNGATASGNLDIGLYLPNGTQVVSLGSTAQSGTSALQELNITDTTIGPGLYYMALAMDGTTGTAFRATVGSTRGGAMGIYEMTSAFALPATATYATNTASYLPLFGFTTRSVV